MPGRYTVPATSSGVLARHHGLGSPGIQLRHGFESRLSYREWDSHSGPPSSINKLRDRGCQGCRYRQQCRGALPDIARRPARAATMAPTVYCLRQLPGNGDVRVRCRIQSARARELALRLAAARAAG
jgi:hypothetical protein